MMKDRCKSKRTAFLVLMTGILMLACIKTVPALAEESATVYEGVDYSRVYDYDYYKNASPDVYAVYGDNPSALLEHFVNVGMAEGRRGSESFNVRAYRNAYQDLRLAFGDDLKAYYMHYIERGWMENRRTTGVDTLQDPVTVLDGVDYSPVYDYEHYKNASPDVYSVYGNDDMALLRHFVENGMSEGRRGNDGFNVYAYKNAYRDLRVAFGDDLKAYYMHYINHGQREGRICRGVDALRDPVTTLDGIDYSAVYDYHYYIQHNPDVVQVLGDDEEVVLRHFVEFGMSEGRKGNSEFDVRSYRLQYQDLRVAFRNNLPAYYIHYIECGRNENRRATGTTALQNPVTILDNWDFSEIYNYYYYINSDPAIRQAVGEDDIAALEHFVSQGLKNDKPAKETFDQKKYAEIKGKVWGDYPKARQILDQVGWDLKAAFDWSAGLPYYGHTDDMPEDASPGTLWYADFGFENKKGNCYVMSGTFYEMAKELGYYIRQFEGGILRADGTYANHSWTELIWDDGKTYVCDPNFTNGTGKNGFLINYGDKGTWILKKYSLLSDEGTK